MKIIRKILGLLIILAGIGLFLYPDLNTWRLNQQTIREIEAFEEEMNLPYYMQDENWQENEAGQGKDEAEGMSGENRSDIVSTTESQGNAPLDDSGDYWTKTLKKEIEKYNQSIYENGQSEFRDAWSVTQSPAFFEDLSDHTFGYLEIPAMNLKLALYVGASNANMAKGAAILGATSIPIGGMNTNSVIAGHRGYRGAPYFREIEKLKVGDQVQITNAWEVLTYTVESIDIIAPTDSDKLKIQEDRDMITLMTCHPYRSHGKYRYVVYCVRTEDGIRNPGRQDSGTVARNQEDLPISMEEEATIEASDGRIYEASGKDIILEQILRRGCAFAIVVMVGWTLWRSLPRDIRKEKRR